MKYFPKKSLQVFYEERKSLVFVRAQGYTQWWVRNTDWEHNFLYVYEQTP